MLNKYVIWFALLDSEYSHGGFRGCENVQKCYSKSVWNGKKMQMHFHVILKMVRNFNLFEQDRENLFWIYEFDVVGI